MSGFDQRRNRKKQRNKETERKKITENREKIEECRERKVEGPCKMVFWNIYALGDVKVYRWNYLRKDGREEKIAQE